MKKSGQKPSHVDTIELTPDQLASGLNEEEYRGRLRDWKSGTTSDSDWDQMRSTDKAFDRWLWRQGM